MFAHGQYFDACTNDKSLNISLLHELPVAGGEFKLDNMLETARPGPGCESGRPWTARGDRGVCYPLYVGAALAPGAR